MTRTAFQPSIEELNYFAVAVLIVAAGFIAFRRDYSPGTIGYYLAAGFLVMFFREFGQRTIGQWMDAQVTLELSPEGAVLSVLVAIFAVLTNLPLILLVPVTNSFDVKSYEHWGKSIDAMWLKREYWLASGGILSLFLGWLIFFLLGMNGIAAAFSLFTIFQLLPLDYSGIPTGTLDGAYILKQSGFIWLVMFGVAIVSVAVL